METLPPEMYLSATSLETGEHLAEDGQTQPGCRDLEGTVVLAWRGRLFQIDVLRKVYDDRTSVV